MPAPIEILYRAGDLLVAAKPAGMLSVPAPGSQGTHLVAALRAQGLPVQAVHRLDREVSGAVLFALSDAMRVALEHMFRERELEKEYWALASGHVRPPRGELKFPILEERSFARVSAHGKPSLTRYRSLGLLGPATELEVQLVTGRYNQIRLHFAHAGYPLVGERKYARGKDTAVRIRSRRVALHAWRLAFVDPASGKRVEIEAPLPDELLELRERAQHERNVSRD